jgi:exopolysaccharide biosynthesis polyprenyl glycosylphosphotransferase
MGYSQSSIRKWWALIDAFSASVALQAALALTNLQRMPAGFRAFLAMRVTVKNLLLLLFFLASWCIVLLCCRLYENAPFRWKRLIMACTIGSTPVLLFLPTSHSGMFGMAGVACFWALSVIFMLSNRAIAAVSDAILRKHQIRTCLIAGSGPLAADLDAMIRQQAFPRHEVVGFLDDEGPHSTPEIRPRIIGCISDLEATLQKAPVDEVLVGLPMKSSYAQIQQVIRVCEMVGVQCKIPSLSFSCSIAQPKIETESKTVVTLKMVSDDFRQVVKRLIDVFGAAIGLVVFAPVLAAIGVIVKGTSSGPAIFAQVRYGRNRRKFRMYKFRTMVSDAEKRQADLESRNEAGGPVFKIRKDPRITPVGRILRKTSLDELPQLWNVLKGEMSLVGPRPLPERDVSRFPAAWLMRRFSVKPGLTCLWQINGRSDTAFDRWIELDLKYIDNWSLRLDLQILAKTVSTILRGQGAA